MWWTSRAFTEILFYQDTLGSVPATNWLNILPLAVRDQCIFKLDQLDEIGLLDYLPDAHYLRIAHAGALYRTFYFELSHRVFVVSHGYVGGNIEWETEHAILHRRKLFRYPAAISANRRAKPIAPSETTKMQYTPYILPLILADLLAADGGPAAKLQTLAAALLNRRFDLRSN